MIVRYVRALATSNVELVEALELLPNGKSNVSSVYVAIILDLQYGCDMLRFLLLLFCISGIESLAK